MAVNPMTLNPQIVGRAENAHKPALARILSRTGMTYAQWVALTLTSAGGGAVAREEIVGRIAGALKIDSAPARSAIAELTTVQLLQDVPGEVSRIELTASGHERYRQIRSAIDEVIAQAYGGIPADDLATAGRVLTLITARLDAQEASA
jgi:DNA-binding MarR family transcriptional regulator